MGLALLVFILIGFNCSVGRCLAEGSQLIETMSLEQKVGQLFIVGFPEKHLSPALASFVSTYKPGAFIFFKRNLGRPDQIFNFNQQLQTLSRRANGVESFLSIDQEGGSVSRIPIVPTPPSARAVGDGYSRGIAREIAKEVGGSLREFGFNMNLAPVLDVDTSLERNGFIGSRSFGSNSVAVAAAGIETAEGYIHAGIIPTAKHFPGIGSEKMDPHHAAISRNINFKNFGFAELLPFIHYSSLGPASAMMISHFSYPQLDPSNSPAPFSKPIMTDLLRGALHFEGLIITDDLQMKGSAISHKPEEAALTSLLAGADMVMLTWSRTTQAQAIARTVRAVRYGEFPMSLLNEKVSRILRTKQAIFPIGSTRKPSSQQNAATPSSILSKARNTIVENIVLKNIKAKLQLPSPVCIFSKYKGLAHRMQLASRSRVRNIDAPESADACSSVLVPAVTKNDVDDVKELVTSLGSKAFVLNFTRPENFATVDETRKLDLFFYNKNAAHFIGQHILK